jgi:PAS domain S-box-containing protein
MNSEKKTVFEGAVKGSQQGVVILDARKPNQPILFANPATAEITGYSEEELLGKSLWILEQGQSSSPEISELKNAVQNGRDCEVIVEMTRKDGSRFWNHFLLSPLREDDGTLTHFAGFHRDITAQVNSMEELECATQRFESSQKRYQALFEYSDEKIIIHDLEGSIIDVNPSAIERFGWGKEEFLGRGVADLHPKEELEESRKAFEQIIENGRHRFETRFVSRDNQIFPAEVSANLFELSGKTVIQEIIREITERKRIEKALAKAGKRAAERERQLEAVLDTVGEGIVTIDSKGKIVLVNSEIERIFGHKGEDLKGKGLSALMPPEYRDAHEKGLRRFVTTRKASVLGQRVELEGLRKNGERFPLEVLISLTEVAGTDHFTGAIRDISERKRAETELKQSNQLLRAITKVQSRYIRESDPQDLFNEVLQELLNLTQSEYGFIGRVLFKENGSPYLRTHAITNIAWDASSEAFYESNSKEGLTFYNLETLFGHVLNTGEPVISNSPETDPRRGGLPEGHPPLKAFLGLPFFRGKQMVGMVGLANRPVGYDKEIAEFLGPLLSTCASIVEAYQTEARRKEAEGQLRQSEARIRAVVSGAVDGIVTADAQGRIESFNPAAETIFGYRSDEVISRNLKMLMPSEVADEHDKYMGRYLRTNKAKIIGIGREVTGQRKDGSFFPMDLAVSEMKVEETGTRSFVGIVRDITERKRVERELKEARDQAEAATRAKGQFLANMSHELRTPMNAVVGMTGLLLDTHLTDVQREYVETVRTGGDALIRLINDILDFSKIESGKLDLEKSPFSVPDCIDEALDLIAAEASEKNLTLRSELKGIPRLVVGDAGRLRQILVNLLKNAVKFTEQGEIRLTARTLPSETGLALQFSVRDSGVGISEEHTEEIFESFRQVSDGVLQGGTGLGLANCRELVELMDGTIEVESELGQGATFRFSVRVESVPESQAPITVEQELAPELDQGASEPDEKFAEKYPLQILIAEDNPMNQRVALRMLERLGYRADTAGNGLEVLTALSRQPYTVVLMDVQMPEMDGIEATKRIRDIYPRPRGPWIVGLTAQAMRRDRERCLEAGMDDYLSKPVRMAGLKRALSKAPTVELARRSGFDSIPTLDSKELEMLFGELGNEGVGLYAEISGLYLEEIPKRMKELRNSISSEDREAAEKAAHTIKGSCRQIGAARMAEIVAEIERETRHGDFSAARDLMAQLHDEAHAVEKEIRNQSRLED